MDHLTGELLECNGAVLDQGEQLAIKPQREILGLQRLAEDRRDIECMRVEEGTDGKRRIGAQSGDPFSDLLCVQQRFIGLLAQPGSDRNASESENKKRIVRISNDAGQLGFENPVQHRNNVFLVYLCHLASPFYVTATDAVRVFAARITPYGLDGY